MKAAANILFCALICSLLCATARGQEKVRGPRVISGIVVEQDGKPLEGARVCALGTRPMAGRIPCSKADAQGQFLINVDGADTYTIGAEHLERGYPPVQVRIPGSYGKPDPIFPTVIIDDVTVPNPVRVVMGAKAGRLLFTILDADSSHPIDKGLIKFCRPDETQPCYSISTAFPNGRFEVLTPEDPFTVEFETWDGPIPEYHGGIASGPAGNWVARYAFDDKGLSLKLLHVDLGQRREVIVRLK